MSGCAIGERGENRSLPFPASDQAAVRGLAAVSGSVCRGFSYRLLSRGTFSLSSGASIGVATVTAATTDPAPHETPAYRANV